MNDTEPDERAVPEGMTELYDADVPRADLVGSAANGIHRPLIAKQADGATGLLDPDFVRSLIAKSEPPTPEVVTMTGSPAAIAALIHAAPVRKAQSAERDSIEKAEMSAKELNGLPDSDFAYIEPGGKKDDDGKTVPRDLRHFAIQDAAHVRDALARAPQSPFGDKAMPAIRRAAKKFGIDVAKESGEPTTQDAEVTKDMAMDDADGMDPTVVMAEAGMEAPGDPGDPGSPAWEAIDAATARKWTAIAARLRTALDAMADREMLETATGAGDDDDAAWDLQDAACAVDYAISVLAPFAVDEQAEADCATDEMEMLGKALAGAASPLETVEALAPLAKAGRTLSAANETALRAAITSLQQIIASLPKAPDAPEAAPSGMQKESEPMGDNPQAVQAAIDSSHMLGTPKEPAEAETPAAIGMPGEVAKAAKPDQMAVYDSDGNLVGVVDPGDVTRLMSAKAPAPAETADSDGTDGTTTPADAPMDATDDGTTPTDLAPAPAATVGIPADAVTADDDGNVAKVATPDDTTQAELLKSTVQDMVKAAIDDYSAGQADVVKRLEDRNRALEERNEALAKQNDTLAKQAADLAERITAVENAPAVMAIASNGAVPPAHMMRGQGNGSPGDITKAQEMRHAFKSSDDAAQQQALAGGLNALAIEELRRIHAAGPH